MASSRRKQDEKNLKTLRELGALPSNKYCFDCNQRGPTYVNVTIGSFVCTKCSGMLRGITPPHRVKSISMATFTNEEIDLLKGRGNDYCKQVWLGLYEGVPTANTIGDETLIRDFMVEKYEKRRYYLDPVNVKPSEETKSSKTNGVHQTQTTTQRPRPEINRNHATVRSNLNNLNNLNNANNATTNANSNGFVADFDRADIFTGGSTTVVNGSAVKGHHQQQQQQQQQYSDFANFDNNTVFNHTNGNNGTTTDNFSLFDLCYSESHGPLLNRVPLFPKCNVNRWSLPIPNAFNDNGWNKSGTGSSSLNGSLNNSNGTAAPVEDRYAALKDLDNEIKSQKNGSFDWTSSSGSNGSLYSSPTPTGSMYSSPSSQGSIFGSPSQGQFFACFPTNQDSNASNVVSNPFNANGLNWSNVSNGLQSAQQPFANPFRDTPKTNGYNNFQPMATTFANNGGLAVNGTNGWTPNPFKVGGPTTMNSNNPFL
ncbi:unnamed protein product [Phyllotreta striolata]|uniref:Arf-GAP domain-containing protein n=1 Tax=Phyllotreta striolata TaxID=444603 RepID=A0A9N9TME4_PHYSR|nr:unnamed protein product [Phyllotreta striolata]